jgi:hypothetical protein
MCETGRSGVLVVQPLSRCGRGWRLLHADASAKAGRRGFPGHRPLAGGGRSAGTVEAAPLLRCEPAEPLRDADLMPVRAASSRSNCASTSLISSAASGAGWAASRCRTAWASEWHPGGHGLHVHFAVGRYVGQRLIQDVWGRGITHIKLIGDLPVGSGALEEARRAAAYLAKYVTKNIADERIPRLHRYEVAQGFQPVKVPLSDDSDRAVIAQASERMGCAPVRMWRSAEQEGWRGAPAYWCAWAG